MVNGNRQFVKITYPFADKFVLVVGKFMHIAIMGSNVIGAIYVFWLGWIFTEKLRMLLDNAFWSVLVYVTSMALIIGIASVFLKITPRFMFGNPAFGDIGGLPIRTLSAALRARTQISVELSESDRSLVKKFNVIQFTCLHDILKANFEMLDQNVNVAENEVEDKWRDVWNQEILDFTVDGQSFREAADVNSFGFNYAISALLRSTFHSPALRNIYWAVIIILIYRYATQNTELLTSIQVGVVLAFVYTGFWHMYVLKNLSVVPLSLKGQNLPETTLVKFSEDVELLEQSEIRPKKINVKPNFYRILRNYQLRSDFVAIFFDVAILILLLGTVYGLMLLIDPEYARSNSSYHAVMAYGFLLGGISLPILIYVFAIVLQNFRNISATLIVALLAAGLPFLIDFLLGGQLNVSGAREAIFAGSGALTVALVTAVTSHVKESIS